MKSGTEPSPLLLMILSLISSSFSLTLKLPQISVIWRNKSVTGINRTSLLIEMWNFMMSMSYSAHFGYPITLYFEYVGMLAQDLIIVYFVIRLSEQQSFPTNRQIVVLILVAATLHTTIGIRLLPKYVPITLITTGLPSGIVSRVIQIRQIIRNKDSGNLSAGTWFMSFVATFCRSMSNYLTVRDGLMLFRVGSACALNLVLTIVILMYRKRKKSE